MKFYDREKELKLLNKKEKLAKTTGAQFTIITGRRRIGKSSLLKHAYNSKKYLYFFVSSKRTQNLLSEFTKIFNKTAQDEREFTNWDLFIKTVLEYSVSTGTTIIFDEFQNFYTIDRSIYSIFQKYWDTYQYKKNLNLIVAGSLISLLEKIFFDEKEPLYKRATGRINLQEFNFKTVRKILSDNSTKNTSFLDLLKFYSVFGGNPYYYNQIFKSGLFNSDLMSIIEQLILSPNSILQNEGKELLIQEFGSEHSTYFSILEAISLGNKTFTEITNYTDVSDSILSRSLSDLTQKFKLIQKLVPVFPNNQNVFKYCFSDNFLEFWFRYIYANQSLIENETTKSIFEKISSELNKYSGLIFEEFCMEFMLELSEEGKLDYYVDSFGKWWDKEGEIDLIVGNKSSKKVFIGECKLNAKSINTALIEKMIKSTERIDALKDFEKKYILFCAETIPNSIKASLPQKVQIYDLKNFS